MTGFVRFLRITCILLLAALCCAAASADGSENIPEQEARAVEIRVSNGLHIPRICDGSYITTETFVRDRELTVSSNELFSCLYIVWNEPPSKWTLQMDHLQISCGENGFLHEFVRLPFPTSSAHMIFEGTSAFCISDVYAFSAGTLPTWVQIWQPPCEKADLLLFPTHSDDELVFFGGLIPTYAIERGLQVQTVYMVDHRYTESHRWHELLDSLWTAGAVHYPVCQDAADLRHSNLYFAEEYYRRDNVTAFQVEQIRRFQPSVIVGHAEDGEYGHPAHQLNTSCLKNAVRFAADPDAYSDSARQYGVWNTPKTYLHLYGDAPTVLDFEHPIGGTGRTAFEIAEAAFEQCVTQVCKPDYHVFPAGSPYDCHVYGLYRSLVGDDIEKNDLFEHISFPDP